MPRRKRPRPPERDEEASGEDEAGEELQEALQDPMRIPDRPANSSQYGNKIYYSMMYGPEEGEARPSVKEYSLSVRCDYHKRDGTGDVVHYLWCATHERRCPTVKARAINGVLDVESVTGTHTHNPIPYEKEEALRPKLDEGTNP